MINNKKPPQRHKLGVLLLAPMMMTLATVAAPVYAAANKAPVCKILSPKSKTQITPNQDVSFSAKATLKDASAGPLNYEWDFSGGVYGELVPNTNPPVYKRPTAPTTTVQFVRDDANYRVRFSATDSQKRRCEATIDVVVGNPPTGLPNISGLVKDAQKTAPKVGSQLGGNEGDIVVLPYPDMTMQAHSDARYQDNLYVSVTPGSFNTLNALVYEKSRKPKQVNKGSVSLRYQAASNKFDPVGAASINSTSQNFPGAAAGKVSPFQDALIQKTDMWELITKRPADKVTSDYMAMSWMDGMPGGMKIPDQGFKLDETLPGSYMPGADNPFIKNDFKDFTTFNTDSHSYSARYIPITDIDDAGQVNPYPLMRVEAVDKNTNTPIANATVDAVVSAAKDFHCSECHAKGKIAAPEKSKVDFSKLTNAYRSSSEYNMGYSCLPSAVDDCTNDRLMNGPGFYEAVDKNGKSSDNLADKEFAAVRNALALHDFYDNLGMNWLMDNGFTNPEGKVTMDMDANCTWCHSDTVNTQYGWGVNTNTGKKSGDMMYYPNLSQAIHNYHGKIQLNPADKTVILRKTDGRPLLWDEKQGVNPNSLFPTVDTNGKSLPMEQSCIRCHSGHREQLYRDRMFTAGVTCADCHGDMAAVGQVHDKPKPGPEGKTTRVDWLDQPDCGSCHMGDGNFGKNSPDAFSAGVMKRAFAENDKSATSRTPMTPRFAVQASESKEITKDDWVDPQYSTRHSVQTLTKPLYRNSRDTHGDVACAACHGGSHEVWANRDPKANDNVTALQLQGHTGTILECNVCHTANSFKDERDLDGGFYMSDVPADSGVLGGPHNMHPVFDEYWWKSSQNSRDINSDGTVYGGWHNNYAKKAGKDGEDQCAACHGNDHKGTRLSKTPVDRVFNFKGFDKKKLTAAGIKSTTVKVAAGSVIGCDTCHTIATSCKGSPVGEAQCLAGTPSVPKSNHDPVISSTPSKVTAVIGEDYSYQVAASDADNDALTYSLGLKPQPIKDDAGKILSEMKIDSKGLLTVKWIEDFFAHYKHGPFTFPFSINVSDGKGGYAVQNVEVTLECPAGKAWVWNYGEIWWESGKGSCVDKTTVSITSTSPVAGISSGEVYSYPVTATDSNNKLPITYSIEQWPEGMNNVPKGIVIDPNTGVITWTAKSVWYGQAFFKVKATNKDGISDVQMVTLTTCVPTKKWDPATSQCVAK